MKKKLIQLCTGDEELGLYNVPEGVDEDMVLNEYNAYDNQDDFDENNKIGADRVYIENYYV